VTGTATPPDGAAPRPSFREALEVWTKIGLLSFGGPAGQIALMHRILVEEKRWISERRFLHALNFCMLLPGPEAQQLATYVGWLLHGTRGGLVAGTLFVLPGFCVILVLSALYALYGSVPLVAGIFFGLKAAVLAILLQAMIKVSKRALRNPAMRLAALLAFGALFVFAVPFPAVVFAAGLSGYLISRAGIAGILPPHAPDTASAIDEAVEVRPTARRAVTIAVAGLAVWGAPVLLLAALFGTDTIYVTVAAFFSKMAMVTFGGAYAVLAYVAQAAVGTYGWLAPGEMLDGLALAETTPGPLILVLTFVGFLAGFREAVGVSPLAGGLIGAALTTWVTFVPCFLWIFLGAPHVERLRMHAGLSGALTVITAAVVGVIGNLALWFALRVLFTETRTVSAGPIAAELPVPGSFDPTAAGLSALAILLLFRTRAGVLGTLAACAAAGLLLR
jgi:chromate transporter